MQADQVPHSETGGDGGVAFCEMPSKQNCRLDPLIGWDDGRTRVVIGAICTKERRTLFLLPLDGSAR